MLLFDIFLKQKSLSYRSEKGLYKFKGFTLLTIAFGTSYNNGAVNNSVYGNYPVHIDDIFSLFFKRNANVLNLFLISKLLLVHVRAIGSKIYNNGKALKVSGMKISLTIVENTTYLK